ncbi:folylpolyglutamate synthase/dihydrofolate synthase family protein [Spirochaetia bacterium 38H-sp]|uniref:Dihydrofolate synthase/folylpolyglutamate synthase n=1 Tax=Rarispira pelagica TaxID=3141764 RepID=A0ABU9UA40_9SPIR
MSSELDAAFSYIESFANFERRSGEVREFKLERVHRLCTLFDNPERAFKVVHIAGSKGKGSTAFYLASILRKAGYKTGLYMSPHLVSYKERISLAGEFWPDEVYISAIAEMRKALEGSSEGKRLLDEVSTFELLTVLGFLIFRKMGCDWAVVETGMGGRLDATNVVLPKGCIITHIELEHTMFLGDTLEAIAGEKAGIIKESVPVLVADQNESVLSVIRKRVRETGSDCLTVSSRDRDAYGFYQTKSTNNGVELDLYWQDGRLPSCRLNTLLDVMGENAALAASAARLFAGIDVSIIAYALESVMLPGRMQLIKKQPDLYVDGSHTADSVRMVSKAVENYYGRSSCIVVFACAADKDAKSMLETLSGIAKRFVITRAGTFKPSFPEGLYELALSMGLDAELWPDEAKALKRAFELAGKDGVILSTGSFYLAGEIIGLTKDM